MCVYVCVCVHVYAGVCMLVWLQLCDSAQRPEVTFSAIYLGYCCLFFMFLCDSISQSLIDLELVKEPS